MSGAGEAGPPSAAALGIGVFNTQPNGGQRPSIQRCLGLGDGKGIDPLNLGQCGTAKLAQSPMMPAGGIASLIPNAGEGGTLWKVLKGLAGEGFRVDHSNNTRGIEVANVSGGGDFSPGLTNRGTYTPDSHSVA